MKQETADQRCVHLSYLTGLTVVGRYDRTVNEYVFEFKHNKRCLKTIYSYGKALAFANGVEVGKRLTPTV